MEKHPVGTKVWRRFADDVQGRKQRHQAMAYDSKSPYLLEGPPSGRGLGEQK